MARCTLLPAVAGVILFFLAASCLQGPPRTRLFSPESPGPSPHEGAASAEGGGSCGGCHHDEAAEVRRSVHRTGPAGSLGCLGCHTPHEGEGEEGPAGSAGEPEGTHAHAAAPRGPSTLRATCASCHPLAEAEFRLPFRHPLGRGGIACTSCHPPHGLPRHELREQLRFRSCVGCHTEKKGPFVFHHAGNRNRLCLSCHEAHGSANRRLLTHATDRMLCFSCHVFIEIFHIQAPGSIYRECITCHTEIHGSNWNRDYLR